MAVDDGINKITFGELEKSSNSIANDLHELYDIGLGSRVALMLPRSYHVPELMLALNKIGATFIPIDLFYPIKRIEYMLNMSQTEYIVTTREIAKSFGLKEGIIPIEDLNSTNNVDVDIVTRGEDLFTIIFTSGTTGLPKGVMISNDQIPGVGISFKEIFNYSQGDVIGHYLGFTFVAGFVVYAALYYGGCCRIFNEKEQKDSLLLIKELKEKHMNSLILPPSIGIPIYENEDLQLDYLVLAGAKLNELSKKERQTKLINFYGTTEIICGVTKEYDLKDIADNNVPLGKPVANSWIYILDDNNNQMPIGVPGEICVSNNYISPGYLNNQELTDEVFIDNPYSTCEDNKRMYLTGDIGFYNFDGEIEIIGREDDQLSVRGFRIESGEILNIMNSFNEISDIYLDVDNDTLTAYYTTSADLNIDEVKEALKINLPYYMVPSLFIELEDIPLNINGKLDKSLLKKSINHEDIEIADEVIRCVVDGFKEVLKLDFVLIDDDFVALGGNSLTAMKLQLILKEKLNVYLSSNELIRLSTPKNIADYIKFNLDIHSITNDDVYTFDELCPLSESQLNVYLDESANNMGTAYNNPFKIEFNNSYSVDDIKSVLLKMFEVFPILKARVLNNEGVLSFVFDAEPEIIEGSLNDAKSFVRPFELDSHLSRFSIIDNNDSIILFADFHHLIFDGTSLNIFLNKFLSVLDGEDVDFVDKGVLRQISFEELIDSDYMDAAHEFFEGMLEDRDEVYDLLASVNNQTDESEFIDTFEMDDEYLTSFLQNNSLTYNQFLTSVFAYTLSRFSGSQKVLFNLIEDGRGHIDLSESVGMYVRTLPVLLDCENRGIDSFLKYSSDIINSVMMYDLYPFRVLAKDYELKSNILFQYSHNLFSDVINKEDTRYTIDELKHDVTSDLSFFIFNNDENKLTIRVTYSSMYSKGFIEHFVESYKLIMYGMIEADELRDINYTSDVDLEILDSYNQTEHPLVYDDILDAFNDNLAKYPENKLVSYNDVSYSYAEGAYIMDAIGRTLVDLGVKAQDCISFLVPRSELYMFSVLGILSIGAVYVPLDETLPDERIEFILKDTNSKAIIVDDNTYKRAKQLTEDSIIILNISDIMNDDIGTLDKLNALYGEVASILYTSGSTGVPKGVKVTRKAILNVAEYYADKYDLNSDDVYALYPSIGFDAGCESIFKAIHAGSCLSIVPQDTRLNMDELNSYFIKQNVTHTMITTQVGKLFMETIENTSLKYLFVGGEKLGKTESPKDYILVDEYGPTETNNFITSINNSNKIDYSSVGYLNYNSKYYILDSDLRRVPLGAVGELYLAGYQVSQGYINREKETDESFLINPFNENENYSKLYRTGDLVRVLPDGSLGIVGRRDGQVKIRGNRVELSEVESTIRDINDVEDVTVQTIDNDGNNELVAYIVTSNDLDDDALVDYVQNHVNRYKPDYMVPSYVVKLDEIPITVNGKVNRKALPEVDLESLRAEYIAPTNKTEEDLVKAFEKVFNLEKVSIYDDFIKLGGDSLVGIKLLSSLKEYKITLADVLGLRTPYAISNKIISDNQHLDLDVYSLESGCPLTEPQLNTYLDILANEKVDSYIIPSYMAISKEYDVNDIIDALNEILIVHPILGMCVSDEFDVPYLIKGSKPQILVESNKGEDYAVEFIKRPFNINECLCKFLIIENDDRYDLVASFHHIVFDGFSQHIFIQDLQSILDGKSLDVDDTFLKASAFAQQISGTPEYEEAEKFYESMLVDSEEAGVLLDSVLPDGPSIKEINLDIDHALLKSFLDKYDVSQNVLFTSAFAYTLSHFEGSDDVLFNLIEAGRDRFGNFNTIGMYVNTIPIRVDCKNPDISSFMEYMTNLVYEVMKYNYYPFRLLANKYHITSNIIFQFLPEWILDYDYYYKHDVSALNVENSILYGNRDLISDFIATINQKSGEYNFRITYSDKYSSDFVNHFLESYKLILHQILHVDKLNEINYLTTAEDIELLDSFNNTEHNLVYDDIMDAFNDNLSKYPENNLVSYSDVSYTYAEIAFLIDKIQKLLNDNDIGVNDNVCVFVERSHWVLLSNLAVLSVGASYVPIDENHPNNRIKYMVENSGSKAIITTDYFQNRVDELVDEMESSPIVINVSSLSEDAGELNSINYHDPMDNDVACILFTSGTTGNPKAVPVGRHSITNMVSYYQHNSNFTSDDVYGVFASVGFDISLQHYVSLFTGGSVIWIPNDIKFNIKKLNEYFIKYGVTHTIITTQVSKLFIQNIDSTSIKNLCAAGEKLGAVTPPENYELVDAYGPTEATSSMTSINVADKIDNSSIGSPDWNTKIYVLDSQQRRVPFGAVGELYISGYPVSRGYLNNPEANRKAFFNNPFDGEIHGYETMYKTGDIVRLLPDGTIGFIGRNDSQVKIRGNRVELSEIESSIRKLDYVSDVTVQTIKHDANNELVAYVVVNNNLDGMELKDSICDYISKDKPEYMVPSYVIKLDEIPLNVNGKVDKRALPEVDRESLHVDYVAPRNENEKEVVEAFEKALDLDKVSIYDDFIRLGGDSLTAIKLLNYIDSDDITMADIYTFRTPEAIAENMSDLSFDLDIYSIEEGCPLNSAQINVFADVVVYNKRDAYHIPGYIAIPKEYNLEDILDALDRLLNAHPILSMRIINEYEVNENADISNLDVLKDLIRTAKKFGIKKIMNIVKGYGLKNVKGLYNMLKTTIRLFKGEYPYMVKGDKPPISVKSNFKKEDIIDFFAESLDIYGNLSKFMIVESEESYYLIYFIHHIIFDLSSSVVFKDDFMTLLDGGNVDFDDIFLKSSAFTHQIKNTEKFEEAEEFYQPLLTDLDDVSVLKETNSSKGYALSFYDLEFDKVAFESFLDNAGISENALFTAVFAYALSQIVTGDKVIFTMIENGRDRFNGNFIGMTSNVMPVVVDCKDQSIDSYIEHVTNNVYGTLRHSYYPILLLYQKYDFEVGILFQFLPDWIAYADDEMAVLYSDDIRESVLNSYNDFLSELFVQVLQNGGNYRLMITNSHKYSDEMINEFKDAYISILSNIINADPSSNLSSTLK